MKTDPTSYVLQTLKKVGPFDFWREMPLVDGEVFRSESVFFKEHEIVLKEGRGVARHYFHMRFSKTEEGRTVRVGISEQMDKVRLVASEILT